jgi:hypothetical protein
MKFSPPQELYYWVVRVFSFTSSLDARAREKENQRKKERVTTAINQMGEKNKVTLAAKLTMPLRWPKPTVASDLMQPQHCCWSSSTLA